MFIVKFRTPIYHKTDFHGHEFAFRTQQSLHVSENAAVTQDYVYNHKALKF